MARPTAFDRQTSFTQFSSNYPAKPQNGASLDSEFNAVKLALDETQSNLALIQDDDGRLARGSVGRGQFDSSVSLGFETPTPWAADTSYTADLSTVFYQAKFYSCVETHVSTDTFDATKWFEIADLSASAAIEDGSVTEAKLASSAVTADKIGALAVTSPKVATGAITNPKLADGAVTRQKVDDSAGPDLASLILPAGLGPIPWSLAGSAPTGWVFDGATYNRADYPVLAALAVADAANATSWFTTGDGSTTFAIKSAKGRTLVGLDSSGTVAGSVVALGTTLGEAKHTLLENELAQHDHTAATVNGSSTFTLTLNGNKQVTDSTSSASTATAGSSLQGTSGATNTPSVTIPAAALTLVTTVDNAGSSDPHNNMQPSIGVRFIFKAH